MFRMTTKWRFALSLVSSILVGKMAFGGDWVLDVPMSDEAAAELHRTFIFNEWLILENIRQEQYDQLLADLAKQNIAQVGERLSSIVSQSISLSASRPGYFPYERAGIHALLFSDASIYDRSFSLHSAAVLSTVYQQIATSIRSDKIYELIDDLVFHKMNLKFKDTAGKTFLDHAILANNYKLVDALLLHGLSDSDSSSDSVSSVAQSVTVGISSLTIDQFGNVILDGRVLGLIANWEAAASSPTTQAYFPNLRIASWNVVLAARHGILVSESALLAFAQSHLIVKLLQDSEMGQSRTAKVAVAGGATGFRAGSVPLRYTPERRQEILENMRMQREELAMRALMAPTVSAADSIPAPKEPGIEMVVMHSRRMSVKTTSPGSNGGWDESKESE